jgi:hypothetical protein
MVKLFSCVRLIALILLCISGAFGAVFGTSPVSVPFDYEKAIDRSASCILSAEGGVEEKCEFFKGIATVIAEHKKLTPGRLTREESRKKLMNEVFSLLGKSGRPSYEKLYQTATHSIFMDLVEDYSGKDLLKDLPPKLPPWLRRITGVSSSGLAGDLIRESFYTIDNQEYDKAVAISFYLASKKVRLTFPSPHPDEIYLDVAYKLAIKILEKLSLDGRK